MLDSAHEFKLGRAFSGNLELVHKTDSGSFAKRHHGTHMSVAVIMGGM